jgi:hypothetical protein
MVPMSKLMKIHFAGAELLTGLPEYRNGGLLIDLGLLTLKPADLERGLAAYRDNAQIKGQPSMEVVPLFSADDDVVVEWRALTVGFLDDLLEEVNGQLGLLGEDQLTLAQMLEAGTWKVNIILCIFFLELVLLTDVSRVVVKSPKFRGRTQKSRLS